MSLRENINLIHIKEPKYYERTNFIVYGGKLNYALTNTFTLNGYITTCDNKISHLIGVKEYTPIAESCSNEELKALRDTIPVLYTYLVIKDNRVSEVFGDEVINIEVK